MNGRLAAVAAAQQGVFTRRQALEAGHFDDQVREYQRGGIWHRLRRGAYADAGLYRSLDEAGRHLLQLRAVLLVLTSRAVASHTSAALLHGYAVWDRDLSVVHVTRTGGGAGREEGGVHHHVGSLTSADIVWRGGVPATRPARAVVESASIGSLESGLVIADSALHLGLTTADELRATLESMDDWPGARTACGVVSFADGGAESPGESRLRLLMDRQGLPRPTLQHDVFDASGHVGRVDFLFADEHTIVEFDGRVKYAGDPAASADAVYREKLREDRLRELGYEVVRVSWSDLADPARVALRIRQAFERARRRRASALRATA